MLCLRIHRGLLLRRHEEIWTREKAAQAAQFLDTDLAAHFKAEEEALFPAMQKFSGASALLRELLAEHRKLEALAERLRGREVAKLADALGAFADLLESHIRKEERELFPLYEKQMSPELAAAVEREVKDIIGDAMEPGNPELLK
jgi:hemerythrin-like domain-containing protein